MTRSAATARPAASHVSVLDDHDMVGRAKRRFAAGNTTPARHEQVAHAVGVQLTTLGIPCIYYGTEQAFDGTDGRHDPNVDSDHEDRYVRETMFGGTFGAFHTQGCHFFDPDHPTYLRIAALVRLRRRHDGVGLALRRGRIYPRETAYLDRPYAPPDAGELVAWSRILTDHEVVVAVNTHGTQPRGALVTVDATLHPPGTAMTVAYRGDWTDAALRGTPPHEHVDVTADGGRSVVRIDLPPAGMTVLV